MTKQLNVAIIDSNPALGGSLCIKKDDPPGPRVSTVTPATISFLQGIYLYDICGLCGFDFKFFTFK